MRLRKDLGLTRRSHELSDTVVFMLCSFVPAAESIVAAMTGDGRHVDCGHSRALAWGAGRAPRWKCGPGHFCTGLRRAVTAYWTGAADERCPSLSRRSSCHDIASILVFADTLKDDLAEQVLFGPGQIRDLHDDLGADPMNAGEDERRTEAARSRGGTSTVILSTASGRNLSRRCRSWPVLSPVPARPA